MRKIINKYSGLLCLVAAFILLFERDFDNRILNKPSWVFWSFLVSGSILSLILTCYIVWDVFSVKKRRLGDIILAYGFSCLIWLVSTFIIMYFLRTPFDYYIIRQSNKGANQNIKCSVTNFYHSSGRMNNYYVHYDFHGSDQSIIIDKESFKKLEQSKSKEKYISLSLKGSIFDTQVIDNYELLVDDDNKIR